MSFIKKNITVADKLTVSDEERTSLQEKIEPVYLMDVRTGVIRNTASIHKDDESTEVFVEENHVCQDGKVRKIATMRRLFSYNTGYMHYLFGERYPLNVIKPARQSRVTHSPKYINIYLGPSMMGVPEKGAAELLDRFYRIQLMRQVPPLLDKWKAIMQVAPDEIRIKKMKTRWGTCNPTAKRIWLSLYLAQATLPCIEYVFVHEMVHLFEANHGARFYELMDKFLPSWRERKKELNSEQGKMSVD